MLFWKKVEIQANFIDPITCLSPMQFELDVGSIRQIKSFAIIRRITGK
jgi:hypothetical protein